MVGYHGQPPEPSAALKACQPRAVLCRLSAWRPLASVILCKRWNSCFKIAYIIAHDPQSRGPTRGPSALAATLVSSWGAVGATSRRKMVYDPQSRRHSLAAPPFWALYASQLGRIDVASVSAGLTVFALHVCRHY
jgi:hypothetical protein